MKKVAPAKVWEDDYRAEIVMKGSSVYEFNGMLHLGVDLIYDAMGPPTTAMLPIPERCLRQA